MWYVIILLLGLNNALHTGIISITLTSNLQNTFSEDESEIIRKLDWFLFIVDKIYVSHRLYFRIWM